MTMRATFYGGPADGGEVTLAEPIRRCIRFPLTPLEAVDLFEPQADRPAPLIPNGIPAHYVLETDGENVIRDAAGRVRYLYRVPKPQPKETTE